MPTDIFLPAEKDKPEVDFRFSQHHLTLRGESYPENAAAFYGPLLAALQDYLDGCQNAAITVDVDLVYFNSSSTKMLLNLFERLNEAAEAGNAVTLNWHFDAEDETVREFGDDLAEDYTALNYCPVVKE